MIIGIRQKADTTTHQPAGPSTAHTVQLAKAALENKKGLDVLTIPLSQHNGMADALIVATGTSERHVQTLADSVIEALTAAGHQTLNPEGCPSNQWVLVDAGSVIVHVFLPETRALYNLEKLWGHDADEDEADGNDMTGS